jgi:hypothetical protein
MPPMPTVTVKSGYKSQSIDTSIEADVLMFQLLRQLTPNKKYNGLALSIKRCEGWQYLE